MGRSSEAGTAEGSVAKDWSNLPAFRLAWMASTVRADHERGDSVNRYDCHAPSPSMPHALETITRTSDDVTLYQGPLVCVSSPCAAVRRRQLLLVALPKRGARLGLETISWAS